MLNLSEKPRYGGASNLGQLLQPGPAIVCVAICLLQVASASARAAPAKAAVAELMRQTMKGQADEFLAGSAKSQRQDTIAYLESPASDSGKAPNSDKTVDDFLAYRACFYNFVSRGEIAATVHILRGMSTRPDFPAVDRCRAAILAYLESDDPHDIVTAIQADPLAIGLFAKVSDLHFTAIFELVLSKCALEQVDVEILGTDPKVSSQTPFTNAVQTAFGSWVLATYVQDSSGRLPRYLWERAAYLWPKLPVRPQDFPVALFESIDVVAGPQGRHEVIRCLLAQGRYHQIADIIEDSPKYATEVRNLVSLYRFQTKTSADSALVGSLQLMQLASPAASGPAAGGGRADH
jgi:hypothetical protein